MSSAATLAVIIPPSIPMILYAVMAETSVVQLFVAGIVPGIIGGFGLMGHGVLARAPLQPAARGGVFVGRVVGPRAGRVWAFLLPIIILGGIFGGVVTATEGAALAVVAALFVGLVIYRELDLGAPARGDHRRRRADGHRDAAGRHQPLLGTYLTEVQAPQHSRRRCLDHDANKWVVLALLNVLFLLLGMFLHSAAAIILVVPVVMPLVTAAASIPVHFGLIVTINLGIGQQTPPVASVLMVASSIAKESIWAVTRVNVWFIGVLLVVLLLVTYVPVVTARSGRTSSIADAGRWPTRSSSNATARSRPSCSTAPRSSTR